MIKEQKINNYWLNKIELDEIKSNITIKRWKILSKAYKQGKKIWGNHFTKQRLATDMEMRYTTVVRCLSLDRCNKKNWNLINSKKISAFKAAQICMSKSRTFQDEMVQMVIDDKLSTYQISSLKINSVKDISKEKHRLACEKGYSRKSSAYLSLHNWIGRGNVFMLMNKDNLPEDKLPGIKKDLQQLKKAMEKYIQ